MGQEKASHVVVSISVQGHLNSVDDRQKHIKKYLLSSENKLVWTGCVTK